MAQKYTDFLKAIANEDRMMMLIMLSQYQEGLTPSQMGQQFFLEYATINHHLHELSNAEVLTISQKGRQSVYKLNQEKLRSLINELFWVCLQIENPQKEAPRYVFELTD